MDALIQRIEAYDPKLSPDNRADELELHQAIVMATGIGSLDCDIDRTFVRSLDAAITLVPNGETAGFRVAYHPELARKSFAEVWTHEDAEPGDGFFRAAGKTPALALVAASLRARANTHQEGSHGEE